ncbi:MAG: hypothetical protein V3U98_01715 [Acidobacteriota bacterium]
MFEDLIALAPEHWQGPLQALLTPLLWIPAMQAQIFSFFVESDSGWMAAAKFILLLFPMLLWIAAIWCTQLALYTLPFRSGRQKFFSMILISWWDAARAAWQYWVGLFRLVAVISGWVFALARMALNFVLEAFRQLLVVPFTLTGKMSRSYFQPGVPWIAFLLLIFWCLLEATIFTYTLFPTISEVLADLVGVGSSRFTGPILFMFLLMLILGSFACLQALLDTIKQRQYKFLVQMVIVELFVMFFEVMFLYRELVDAITPWIAQHTSEELQLGIGFTLSVAAFGWVGIRGMTWFLFGQFGTPPLLAFISRRPMEEMVERDRTQVTTETQNRWWQPAIQDFKRETGWLHERADELVEYLTLPVLQVIGAVMNFASVLVTSRPVFSLPFRNVKEVMETRQILTVLQIDAKPMEAGKVSL